ncbi:CPBP family intramembrane metalloprotease [Stenotrophomonas maltophilia]|uniref:CPBP family glutamic-type intramembrane protease n=1 Tax=Stenotrophomonas TaxID=40323 RepID=UPI0015DF61A4|nr:MULTISPECIES: CPBP family glutamic-type intramembrane protease [Stenotrophomonas]MBA0260554.1 CPBP family intramembrane metalloprotease [Stenotrophomonas maltophilia]MBB1135100.1 CPBP family intramembrane metalloprotease [Stenotrophomonas sp. I18B00994]MCU1093848.1 CPBP family intramembrane metalloprotease [Stenotrophomonas maltophilia]HEI8112329.1 CPBP family intramembrane metalloprotease [Stenotrophomonas maltophilia]HEL4835251.1 CPBP family intramembrane metalloprotease [Stenotrophomonas
MTVLSRLPTTARLLLVLLGVGLGLNLRDIATAIGTIPALPIPYGGSLLDNALAVLVALLLAALLRPRGMSLLASLGLRTNGWSGPMWVLLASLPCWLGLALLGTPNTALTVLDATMLAVLFPLAEEVLFRGLGFVLLVKIVRGPWPWLALPQALLFGMVHWFGFGGFDGGGIALFVGAVIGLGGFIFAWLDHLDGNTLWCGLVLHVSMNLAWNVFSLDDALALGWQATSLRIGTALLAVAVLAWHVRLRRQRSL